MNKTLLPYIKNHLKRHRILLAAFQRMNQSRDYYKRLDNKEDFEHNMDQLFDELETLYDMMFNEDVELHDVLYEDAKKKKGFRGVIRHGKTNKL